MEKNRAHHILSLKHHIIQCAYIFTAIRRPHDHRLHYYHQHTLFMFCMCASSQLEMIFPFFSHNYAANGAATTDRGRFLLHTIIIHCRTLSLQHSQVLFTNCSQFVRLHLLLWHYFSDTHCACAYNVREFIVAAFLCMRLLLVRFILFVLFHFSVSRLYSLLLSSIGIGLILTLLVVVLFYSVSVSILLCKFISLHIQNLFWDDFVIIVAVYLFTLLKIDGTKDNSERDCESISCCVYASHISLVCLNFYSIWITHNISYIVCQE